MSAVLYLNIRHVAQPHHRPRRLSSASIAATMVSMSRIALFTAVLANSAAASGSRRLRARAAAGRDAVAALQVPPGGHARRPPRPHRRRLRHPGHRRLRRRRGAPPAPAPPPRRATARRRRPPRARPPVGRQVFSKSYCPFCDKTKRVFRNLEARTPRPRSRMLPFTLTSGRRDDRRARPNGRGRRDPGGPRGDDGPAHGALRLHQGCVPAFAVLFRPSRSFAGTHIGGNDDTQQALASGKLEEMLGV